MNCVNAPLVATVALLLLIGCGSVPDKQWAPMSGPQELETAKHSEFMTAEINDDGQFHSPEQISNLERWLDVNPNDPIILFVHGWHHNAKPSDKNLVGFKKFLIQVEAESCRSDSKQPASVSCHSLDGIYVGWRGDEVQLLAGPQQLDFPTIVSRKSAAKRVGAGGLKSILTYINERFPTRTVIIAGHSLGGAAVFYALESSLDGMVNNKAEYILVNPAVGTSEFSTVESRILADSPLIPSHDSEGSTGTQVAALRLHRRLIVLQATGDTAISKLYPIAFKSDTPIGFDKTRATHIAYRCSKTRSLCDPGKAHETNFAFSKVEVESGQSPNFCSIFLAKQTFVLQTVPKPTSDESCWSEFSRPVWVVAMEPSISGSHNDIFNTMQAQALADLIVQRLRSPK